MKNLIVIKEQGLQKLLAELAKQDIKLAMRNLTINKNNDSKKLYVKNKMYIPNDKNLQLFLLQQYYNFPM